MGKATGDLAAMFLSTSELEQDQLQSFNQPPSREEKAFIYSLRAKSSCANNLGSVNDIATEKEVVTEVSSAEFVLICLRRIENVDDALIDHIYNTHIEMNDCLSSDKPDQQQETGGVGVELMDSGGKGKDGRDSFTQL